MADPIKLPPGATLVNSGDIKLPPGATLVTSGAPPSATSPQPSIMSRLFGEHPIDDSISVVGNHLKNVIAGPYHAFTDAPRSQMEQQEKGTTPSSGAVANGLGQFGLGMARMLVNPTREALAESQKLRDQGGPQSSLLAPSTYDANGNNVPTAGSKLIDGIPIYGPWARGAANDSAQHGFVPAALGVGTDILAPRALGAAATTGARGIGLGTSLTAATDASRNLAASRVLLKGTPGELLQSALKPGVKYGAGVDASLTEALPHVIAADPALNGVSGFASASDKARSAAHAPFQTLLNKTESMPISSQAIADAARGSVSRAQEIEDPLTGAVRAADRHAGIYDDKFGFTLPKLGIKGPYQGPSLNVGDLNEVRSTKNAQLQNLFADTPADRASVLKANPNAARLKAIRDEAADTQYGAMSGLTGVPQPDIQAMQDKYGLLRDVSDIANKRDPVFARHDPVSLSTKIVSGHGNPLSAAWNYVLQSKLGTLTDSDAQVNSAIDRFRNPDGTPLVARPGILPKLAMPIGTALRKTPNVPLLLNPFFLGKNSDTD